MRYSIYTCFAQTSDSLARLTQTLARMPDVMGNLRRLHELIRKKRPKFWAELLWVLLHDNAPVHRPLLSLTVLRKWEETVLQRPPFYPDLTPFPELLRRSQPR
ncbi:hypothetical protein TNCV_4758361 [Trichonephila clavipes]|nr:hypothetical protein TNCV_4758361 [Trichonephila clavipes]